MKRQKRLMPPPPDPDRPVPLRVLHVAGAVAPFGEADAPGGAGAGAAIGVGGGAGGAGGGGVVAALTAALADRGVDVDVLVPRARGVDPAASSLARRLTPVTFTLDGAEQTVALYEGKGRGRGVRVLFAEHAPSLEQDAPLWGAGAGDDADDPRGAAVLCRTALGLGAAIGRRYDVVHAHDWPGALCAWWLRGAGAGAGAGAGGSAAGGGASGGVGAGPKSVLTIREVRRTGRCGSEWLERIGLSAADATEDGLALDGRVSLLKAGLVAAGAVTTVSPRWAEEIRTPEHGGALAAALRARGEALVGILDGADYAAWDPMNDGQVVARYSSEDIAPKRRCKADLQRALHLPVRAEVPVLGSVAHLSAEKGYDVLAAALGALVERGVQVALLGSGERALEEAFQAAAKRWPNNVSVKVGIDEANAHRIVAGSDFYAMPSRVEPCGLFQLYALRYGAVPVVHAVGGLADTVEEVDAAADTGTGFRFAEMEPAALVAAVERGLAVFRDPPHWRSLQKRCMTQDFSWAASAERYFRLYVGLTGRAELLPPPQDDDGAEGDDGGTGPDEAGGADALS
ncbi:MAG TPA: glycogen/starch synthase [Myxococcota bacterium]|jgi:starch synthase|nr:glycogen/starch synthase [Myxococcota bacterium]